MLNTNFQTYQEQAKKQALSNATKFFSDVCSDMNFSTTELKKCGFSPTVLHTANNNKFSYYSGFDITYLDVNGEVATYKNASGVSVPYQVFRYETPPIGANGKPHNKYRNPEGTPTKLFYNGLFAFANELQFARQKNQDLHKIMVFPEGGKKAADLCKYGVPAIGINGIQGVFTKTIQGENETDPKKWVLNESFVECWEKFKFEKAVFFLDTDSQDHYAKNHGLDKLKRNNSFTSATKSFVWACKQLGVTPYIAVLNSSLGAKAFDDIKNKNTKKTVAHDLRALWSSEVVTVLPVGEYSENLINLIIGGLDTIHYQAREKYLSNDPILCELLDTEIRKYDNLLIQAPTGIGKTTYLVGMVKQKLIENPKAKICMVFPTNSLLDSYEKQFEFFSKMIFNQRTTQKDRQFIRGMIEFNQLIITTYHSFHKIASGLQDNCIVIFDEWHKATITPLPKEFYAAYQSLLQTNCKKIHVTATPIYNLAYCFEQRFIKITSNRKKPNLNIYKTKNVDLACKEYINRLNNSGINVVFLQDTQRLNEFAKEFAGRFEVQMWNSCDLVRQTDYYQHFTRNNEFLRVEPNKPLLILATSYIYEGVSFLNSDIATVSIFGESVPQNILQALNRTRNYSENTVFNVFLTYEPKSSNINFVRTFYHVVHSNRLANGMEKNHDLRQEFENWIYELRLEGSFTNYFDTFGNSNDFEICKKMNSGNLLDVLGEEYTIQPIKDFETSLQQLQQLTKQDKETKKVVAKKAYKILTETPQKAIDFVYSNTNSKELKDRLKHKYNANYDSVAKEYKPETYELEAYFNLERKLEKINVVCQDVDILFKHRSERLSKKMLEVATCLQLVRLGENNLPHNQKRILKQIKIVESFVMESKGTHFGSKSELKKSCYDYLYQNYTDQVYNLKKQRAFGLGTDKKAVGIILDVIANVKQVAIIEGQRYYKANLKKPKDVLREFGLQLVNNQSFKD